MGLRVMVVEDDGFTRMLLCAQLRELGHIVVGDGARASEGMEIVARADPQVAMIDLDLGRGPTGMDLAHALRRSTPSLGILMLSTYMDSRLIGDTRELPPGAVYLVKRAVQHPATLDAALQLAWEQEGRADGASGLGEPVRLPRIRGGQLEILRLVAEGYSNGEIARRRSLTEAAVGKAISRLCSQLGITAATSDNQRVLIAQTYFRLSGAVRERSD